MIESIIFDLGGVLVSEASSLIEKTVANHLSISQEKLNELSINLKSRATTGEISLLELYNQVIIKLDSKINPKELLSLHLLEYERLSTSRDSRIINLFNQLKKNDYLLACLTNTEIEIAQFNRKIGLFDYFGEYTFLSTEMGKRKPQPEIYLEVAHQINCTPEECIFIDDKKEYVKSAVTVGMSGIIYENVEQLVRGLRKHQINIS
jgi:FMN phosphatase YigB (HAD superfamily)